MPQSHIDDPNEPKYMARPCAMCGFPMFLSVIEPSDKPDHDRRLSFNARPANILRA